MSQPNDNSFWNRRVSIWHIVYMAIICLIIIVSVLVIIPGRINEDAYQNFSFASTITSIVLAVVSIVYSIQSGLSTGNQMCEVKNIEHQISEEVTKLSNIDKNIREIINPLSEKVGDISDAQSSLQQTQDKLIEQVERISLKPETIEITQASGNKLNLKGPSVLSLTLYTAIKSKKTEMDFPFHKFAKYMGKKAVYCEGLLEGLTVLHSEKIAIVEGSKYNRKKVLVFDESYFGSEEFWEGKVKVKELENRRLSNDLLNEIKEYYTDVHNQESNVDCV